MILLIRFVEIHFPQIAADEEKCCDLDIKDLTCAIANIRRTETDVRMKTEAMMENGNTIVEEEKNGEIIKNEEKIVNGEMMKKEGKMENGEIMKNGKKIENGEIMKNEENMVNGEMMKKEEKMENGEMMKMEREKRAHMDISNVKKKQNEIKNRCRSTKNTKKNLTKPTNLSNFDGVFKFSYFDKKKTGERDVKVSFPAKRIQKDKKLNRKQTEVDNDGFQKIRRNKSQKESKLDVTNFVDFNQFSVLDDESNDVMSTNEAVAPRLEVNKMPNFKHKTSRKRKPILKKKNSIKKCADSSNCFREVIRCSKCFVTHFPISRICRKYKDLNRKQETVKNEEQRIESGNHDVIMDEITFRNVINKINVLEAMIDSNTTQSMSEDEIKPIKLRGGADEKIRNYANAVKGSLSRSTAMDVIQNQAEIELNRQLNQDEITSILTDTSPIDLVAKIEQVTFFYVFYQS